MTELSPKPELPKELQPFAADLRWASELAPEILAKCNVPGDAKRTVVRARIVIDILSTALDKAQVDTLCPENIEEMNRLRAALQECWTMFIKCEELKGPP